MFFFFNDTATTEIYTLSLHDALPISSTRATSRWPGARPSRSHRTWAPRTSRRSAPSDRKSTRLNSSHSQISYAVFCLKKKNVKPDFSDSPLDIHHGNTTRVSLLTPET